MSVINELGGTDGFLPLLDDAFTRNIVFGQNMEAKILFDEKIVAHFDSDC